MGDNLTYQNLRGASGGKPGNLGGDRRAPALRGAQLLVAALRAEGVDTIFGYPGGANLEIFDALRERDIGCVRTSHEQGAVHAAQGYARATGRVGVCLATSGPGATNLVTGIADANSDSTAIVCITGNVPTHLLGKNAFQEVDIVGVTGPITKKNYLIWQAAHIPRVVREAFALAGGNRPGPVLIDVPKDVQQEYARTSRIPAVTPPPEPSIGGLTRRQLEKCRCMLENAERPVIYAGGGIISADCAAGLLQVAEAFGIPVATTLMGHGAFPPEHPLALHSLGMHGSVYANVAVNEADLVLALGVRFDDRVTGNVQEFIKHGRIVHIDIDQRELNKNKVVTLAICADVAVALKQLVELPCSANFEAWRTHLADLRAQHPFDVPESDGIRPQYAIRLLSKVTNGEAIVSLGVGQHQMWAMQHYGSRHPRSFLSSSGFGTMGYGLPAAIGAKVAFPERTVVDIDGDGSFNMTINELATCRRHRIGVKVVVINNQWLGMVRQWQDMIYHGHRASSASGDPTTVPRLDGGADIYPDFVTIARGYRVDGERVTDKRELEAAYGRMLEDPHRPYVVDVIVEGEEDVRPMIPAGGSYRDMIS